MQNTSRIVCLGLAITLGGATNGMAETDGMKGMHPPRPSFEALDSNGDGAITRDEIEAHRAARFASADTDGNGSLSRDELAARAKARMERRIDRMIRRHDADGDGALSPEELQSRHRGGMFERMDADGDGAVTAEEFADFKPRHGHRKHKQSAE